MVAAISRRSEAKKKKSGEIIPKGVPIAAVPKPVQEIIIWEGGKKSPGGNELANRPMPDREKREAKIDEADVSPPKRIHAEVGPEAKRVWCPDWDIQEGDSLFRIGENGRCVNMNAFKAFRLLKDLPRLEKTDVEESYGAAMGRMARGLTYLAQNIHQIDHLLKDYRKLEDMAEKSAKYAEDLIAQREWMCGKKHKAGEEAIELRKEVRRLENENKVLSKKGQELEADLRKAKEDAVAEFKEGEEFRVAVEEATMDKFGEG